MNEIDQHAFDTRISFECSLDAHGAEGAHHPGDFLLNSFSCHFFVLLNNTY